MLRFRLGLRIDAPPEGVFDLYIDPGRMREWQFSVRAVDSMTGPLDEVGSRYIVRFGGPLADRLTVTKVERPRLHAQRRTAFGIVSNAVARFVPDDDGTRFSIATDYLVPWGPLEAIVEWLMRPVAIRMSRRELHRLKALAEREATHARATSVEPSEAPR